MRRRGPNWRVGLDSTAGGRRQPTVGAGRSSRERRYVGAVSRPPERRRTVIRSTARFIRSRSFVSIPRSERVHALVSSSSLSSCCAALSRLLVCPSVSSV